MTLAELSVVLFELVVVLLYLLLLTVFVLLYSQLGLSVALWLPSLLLFGLPVVLFVWLMFEVFEQCLLADLSVAFVLL